MSGMLAINALEEQLPAVVDFCRKEEIGVEVTAFAYPGNLDDGFGDELRWSGPSRRAGKQVLVPEPHVSGIGGVFFRAQNPGNLQQWYERHLGLKAGPYGLDFHWRLPEDASRVHRTVWNLFPRDTDYFGSAEQQFMVNYIVNDLDLVLARLAVPSHLSTETLRADPEWDPLRNHPRFQALLEE